MQSSFSEELYKELLKVVDKTKSPEEQAALVINKLGELGLLLTTSKEQTKNA